tara:strand:+ start:81 stop:371 length:291 start_codon:yes stop_codon:yes gene_type:complete
MSDQKVYVLANLVINDKETYRLYEKGFFPLLKKHGGEFITFDNDVRHFEGVADLNGDKKLTNGELQEYLLDNVGRYAQQQQTPQMIGDPNQVLVQF